METLEEATAYFKSFRRTFRKKRSITLFAIAVVDGRLKVIEGLPQ